MICVSLYYFTSSCLSFYVAANGGVDSVITGGFKDIQDKEGLVAATAGLGLTVVDYWAPWCKNCKKITPVLTKLSTELSNVQFVKVNTQDAEALAADQGVDALPSFQFFKGGKLVGSFKGSDAVKIEAAIRAQL